MHPVQSPEEVYNGKCPSDELSTRFFFSPETRKTDFTATSLFERIEDETLVSKKHNLLSFDPFSLNGYI